MNIPLKTNNRATVVAVDFDGCLVVDRYPSIGQENDNLFRTLIKFRGVGGKVILWTCRSGELLEMAVRYCAALGLEFDAVNENLPELIAAFGTDPRKIGADCYIDDKAAKIVWNSRPVERRRKGADI